MPRQTLYLLLLFSHLVPGDIRSPRLSFRTFFSGFVIISLSGRFYGGWLRCCLTGWTSEVKQQREREDVDLCMGSNMFGYACAFVCVCAFRYTERVSPIHWASRAGRDDTRCNGAMRERRTRAPQGLLWGWIPRRGGRIGAAGRLDRYLFLAFLSLSHACTFAGFHSLFHGFAVSLFFYSSLLCRIFLTHCLYSGLVYSLRFKYIHLSFSL